jgi:hypothetical protein
LTMKYTNRILVGLYLLGLLIILATMIVIRYRLDRIVEVTI